MKKNHYCILIYCLFIIGCAIRPRANVKKESETIAIMPPPSSYKTSEYCLGFGDVIEVKFFNNWAKKTVKNKNNSRRYYQDRFAVTLQLVY